MCSIQQMTAGQEGNESQEDLWCAIEQDKELTLMPSEIVCDGGEAVDLETFRADLHKMIDKVYAESNEFEVCRVASHVDDYQHA